MLPEESSAKRHCLGSFETPPLHFLLTFWPSEKDNLIKTAISLRNNTHGDFDDDDEKEEDDDDDDDDDDEDKESDKEEEKDKGDS